ncbi:hypothetical protein JZX87_02740 [Agrobacterium sp. Ap1]|uniref:hypothetical protein n=1 Tax=Agrobacterium sp. Ap1 TaxID=2815337 RepID=UPI001A8C66CD|nr:hypothetical protein [Agrobacterium sp. Ap1]MBO0140084.1 hypothetical protein [Agrobacterium sp. Ap1]
MGIRHELNRQSILAGQRRGKGDEKSRQQERQRWCGSNAILAMMAGILAVVCVIEILHG